MLEPFLPFRIQTVLTCYISHDFDLILRVIPHGILITCTDSSKLDCVQSKFSAGYNFSALKCIVVGECLRTPKISYPMH